MSAGEFETYRQGAVENYAQDHVEAGNWHPSEAVQKAEADFLKLLPDGITSKQQHLFSIKDEQTGANVGMIWFAVMDRAGQPAAFIYDFMIYEAFRRRGYGKQALTALEETTKELGLGTISLHVFGHNQAAIALYQKVGYETTDIHMTKRLSH